MPKKIFNRIALYFSPDRLMTAIRNEDTEQVKTLLDLGASIQPSIYKNTDMGPLATALRLEHKAIIGLLLDHEADMYAADPLSGKRPIDQILEYRKPKPELLSLFIDKGFDIKKMVDEEARWSVLHLAADRGTPAIINTLLANGADINAQSIYGETPLHRASSLRNGAALAEALIKGGASTDVLDNHGRTPLQVAQLHGFNDIAALYTIRSAPLPAQIEPPKR